MELRPEYPCIGCQYQQNCSTYRACAPWRLWFKFTWKMIMSHKHRLQNGSDKV